MSDNVELILRLHALSGEDVTVVSTDFGEEREALEVLARAVDDRRCVVLIKARYNREADESGVVLNLANVVSVRVSQSDRASGEKGQYL
jgi:hypothetical protein